MGTPFNPGSGHVNQALTNLVVAYPPQSNFIADQICNVVPVEKESDKFFELDSGMMIDQSARTQRAAGAESNEVSFSWREQSFLCEEHALHADLDWRTRDNADNQLQLETAAAAHAREGILLAKEIRAAAVLFSGTYMTNTDATVARWDDATVASIKMWNDILDSKRKVRKFGGAKASHIAVSDATWTAMAKYFMAQGGTTAGIRWQGIAQALRENPDAVPEGIVGLKLLVGDATYSSAKAAKDVSRASSGGNISDVWTDNALVFHKGVSGVKTVQLAARFMKSGYPQVRQGTYSGPRKADWYEYGENESGVKVISASCGHLITNTLT